VSDSSAIFVAQPTLPPLEEFIPYLDAIWERKILTNGGPFHQQLEGALAEYLGVEHVALFANATIALIAAPPALDVRGEVITTPYSFVATAHSLLWNGLTPVFVDVEPATLNLDPARIEAAITPRTSAIMPVHCYGHPCDVGAIKEIADRHGLRVIYDAAHAFGVELDGESVLRHGDLSIVSFHATKVFNTFEGGALICPDAATKLRIDRWKNFGIVDEVTVEAAGMNGKMSELNAAFGLVQLRHVDAAIARRAEVAAAYRDGLADVSGIRCLPDAGESRANHAYFPIIVEDDYPLGRDALFESLRAHEVFARRYFHPLLTEFPMYRALPSAQPANLPVATDAARRVLCLPMHSNLSAAQVERIIDLVAARSVAR
jgi:dTDP-4-amino-4,6-dideoxygalactose transaminase